MEAFPRRLAAILGLTALLAGCAAPGSAPPATIRARLVAVHPNRLPVSATVVVRFDRPVDPLQARVALRPDVASTITWRGGEVEIVPSSGWAPATTYRIRLQDLKAPGANLDEWSGTFTTQPRLGVSSIESAGTPLAVAANLNPAARVSIQFPVPMVPESVTITLAGTALPAAALDWGADDTAVSLSAADLPLGQPVTLAVTAGTSQEGDILTDPAQATVRVLLVEPSNNTSGIQPGFQTVAPLEIVIENSGPARPQSGLQQADMVFEYISEYSITRMTALYFNSPPGLIGPVRSCRLINPPLNFAFHGLTMCSGASVGTLHFMFSLAVPAIINDFDYRNHFFRVGFKAAPHNLYTDQGRALRLRREDPLPDPGYLVDPVHPDSAAGDPAPPPSVPLHAVGYRYDPSSERYLRFDHGSAFRDAGTGAQLQVKNVILIHVNYQVAPYIEDHSGGARSIRYFMVGDGPADVYSDGRVIHATWHMGSNSPMYFTDAQGRFIELNTGLTWIHVLGNGQYQ